MYSSGKLFVNFFILTQLQYSIVSSHSLLILCFLIFTLGSLLLILLLITDTKSQILNV